MHPHTHACARTHTHTHTRTRTHAHTHTHTHARAHTHTHTHPDHLVTGTSVHTPDTNGGIRRRCNGYFLRTRAAPAVVNTQNGRKTPVTHSELVL